MMNSFAPRNFLTALALTYRHGPYFTYPRCTLFFWRCLTPPVVILRCCMPRPPPGRRDRRIHTKPATVTFLHNGAAGQLVMSLGISLSAWRGYEPEGWWWQAAVPACSPPAPAP